MFSSLLTDITCHLEIYTINGHKQPHLAISKELGSYSVDV